MLSPLNPTAKILIVHIKTLISLEYQVKHGRKFCYIVYLENKIFNWLKVISLDKS